MKKIFILIFLLLVVNSKSVVYSQSSDNQICSGDNSPCVKLNGLLSSCGGAISPPPDNVPAFEYGVDNDNLAPCMCNQEAYDTLSNCVISCFSKGNSNIKAVDFVNYQKSCKKFGFNFGPPIKDSSSSDTAGVAKKALIFVFSAITILILGGLLFWYWYKKRSKRLFNNSKKPSFEDDDEPPREQMTVHHPSPGSGISVSSIEDNNKPKYHPPGRTPGLFPPPGTIQSQYPPTPPPQPQHPGGNPYYNSPNQPPASQQSYFPPQPLQPPQPPQRPPQPLQPPQPPQRPPQPPFPPFQSSAQMYSRPPPVRNPYQQPQRPPFRNSPNPDYRPPPPPPPPNNYYNPNNYYH